MSDPNNVAGLVLAAGSSKRLGQPKQLLAFRGKTLLDASLDVARSAPLTQRLVTVGGAAPEVLEQVDLVDFTVVDSLHFTSGCSSSIVSALDHLHPDTSGIVLLLGDQPGVKPSTISNLVHAASLAQVPLAVCRYQDGIGHPFWFGKEAFPQLRELQGDKAVWKLIESGRFDVLELKVKGPVPLDVDTWDDYTQLLDADHDAP